MKLRAMAVLGAERAGCSVMMRDCAEARRWRGVGIIRSERASCPEVMRGLGGEHHQIGASKLRGGGAGAGQFTPHSETQNS